MFSSPDVARMKQELARLIAIDTQNPPGREAPAAQYLHELLASEGFDVLEQEYKPGRVNVVARLENGAGPVFAFNTHMDVVPAGDGWSSDPFALAERDGRLYGRGACDCKGPLAAMLEAMRMLAGDCTAWSGTLLGVFVADEEIASEGARFYAAGHPRIDAAVIGEPTSNAVFRHTRAASGRSCGCMASQRIPARRIWARTRSIGPANYSGLSPSIMTRSSVTAPIPWSAQPAMTHQDQWWPRR